MRNHMYLICIIKEKRGENKIKNNKAEKQQERREINLDHFTLCYEETLKNTKSYF